MIINKKISIVGIVIISILFTSTSYAEDQCAWPTNPVKENLDAKLVDGKIGVEAWDFQVSGPNTFCYQVRYYLPDTTFCDTGYLTGPVFTGDAIYYTESDPYEEEIDPGGIMGDWNVVLMKGGNTKDGCDTTMDITSDRVTVLVHVPEFPSIALPIGIILGLMFIINRRKKN